ncbi:MAG: NifU family protein [Vulcanimicrobiaceae bacterium]
MLRRIRSFARLTRPAFLAGGFVGGGLGTAIAAYERGGTVDWGGYALAQLAITSFHLMTHYANDFFDRDGDALTVRTEFSGGSGVLVDGSLPAGVGLAAALACLGAGALSTALLAGRGLVTAALLAVLICALAWSYSAPPMRLSSRGLGELNTALVVAVLVPLCAFAAQGRPLDPRALWSTLPGAAAMFAMMLAVEYPDAAADAASGKRNLIVRLGERGAKAPAYAAVAAVYAALGGALLAGAPPSLALLELLSLPLAVDLWGAVSRRRDGRDDPALAARGVAFFFCVSFFALAGYAAVATKVRHAAVERHVDTQTALAERVKAALDDVRPGIVADGGDVWLIKIEERVAYVQLVGACGGCPMSNATLKFAVEETVRRHCPEIERVEQL